MSNYGNCERIMTISAWTLNGMALMQNGAVLLCDRCPCGTEPGPCCPNVPLGATLFATVTVFNCPNAGETITFPLAWDGKNSEWTGSANFGGTGGVITLWLRCSGGADTFRLDELITGVGPGNCYGFSPGVIGPDLVASCDPFEIAWTAHTIGGDELCNCGGAPGTQSTIQITITL